MMFGSGLGTSKWQQKDTQVWDGKKNPMPGFIPVSEHRSKSTGWSLRTQQLPLVSSRALVPQPAQASFWISCSAAMLNQR